MRKKNGITGLILSGGKSKRMGYNKALLKISNKFLIEKIIEEIKPFVNEIVISISEDDFKKYSFLKNVFFVKDKIKNIGPISGIYSGLCYSKYLYLFVISADAPFIDGRFIVFLKNNINYLDDIVAPYNYRNNYFEPLFSIYKNSKKLKKIIYNNINEKEYCLKKCFYKANVKKINVKKILNIFDKNLFFNMNDYDEYVRIRGFYEKNI